MYKIPNRQVYCDSLKYWFSAMIWIFFVIKIWPDAYCDYY